MLHLFDFAINIVFIGVSIDFYFFVIYEKREFLVITIGNRHNQAIILLKTMDKGYEKEEFETLKIKSSVAVQFRKFSKILSKSQSMTLLLMMDFFNENGISPAETLGPRMETLENRISILIKKRMNGMIAIMKDIEKSQTKPTVAMMQALFEHTEPPKKKLILAKEILQETKDVEVPVERGNYREKKYLNTNDND